jgi:hypothetical protein
LFDDVGHVLHQPFVVFPLLKKDIQDALFGFRVDNVDRDRERLAEAVDPVDTLNEVIELVRDSDEYGVGTMALKIASGTGDLGLCRQVPVLPIRKVHD